MDGRIKVTKNIVTPLVVKNEDEFLKLVCADVICWSLASGIEDIISPLKHLLHDYLALVLTGKMNPFEVIVDDNTKSSAKGLLNEMTMFANNVGIPLKETEKGELQLDIEEIMKRAKK